MAFTLATWNINSVRLREGLVSRLLREEGPDVLCLQECKSPVDKLPAEFIMLARVFTTLGGLFVHYKPQLDVNKHLFPHLVGPAMSSLRN